MKIKLPSIDNPVPYLAFLLVGGEVEGDFEMNIKISDGADSVIFDGPSSKVKSSGRKGKLSLGVNITGLKFPRVGLYKVMLFVDGRLSFDEIFEVALGSPAAPTDVARLPST